MHDVQRDEPSRGNSRGCHSAADSDRWAGGWDAGYDTELTVALEARVPAPHHHDGFDEMLYGLWGKLRMTVEGKTTDVAAGDSLFVPRGAVHGFENPCAEPAKVLAVITPGDRFGAQYFRELAALLAAGGPPDPKAVAAVMLRYGLVPA